MKSATRILSFLLTVMVAECMAQPMFYFRNLNVSNGLPSNVVHSFCEDEQGLIWIGTRDGLVRYDGVSFENFFHDPTNNSAIGGNSISWDMQKDGRGRIWITLHGKGLSRFDPEQNAFQNFSYSNGAFKQSWTNDAEQLVMLPNGNVLLVCQRGIVQIDTLDQVSVLIDPNKEKLQPDPGTFRFAAIHEERWLWLTTSTEIRCLDLQEKRWESSVNNPRNLTLLHRKWQAHGVLYSQGKLWFSTYFRPENSPHRFLFSFDFKANRLDSIAIAPDAEKKNPFSDQVHSILIQENGTIWLGTEGIGLMGLLAYDPKTEEWVQYRGSSDWTGSILPGPVRTLFEDRNHNIWIGTHRGVSLMAPDKQYFLNYTDASDEQGNTVSLSQTGSMVVTKNGDIWLGAEGDGMLLLDPKMKLKSTWRNLLKTAGAYRNYVEPRTMKQDTLIFHAWYDGLLRMKVSNGEVFRFSPITDQGNPELNGTLVGRNGTVYAYGWGRFGKLNIKTGKYDFAYMPLNADGRPDRVMASTEDDQGRIWLGLAQNGILCIDPKDLTVVYDWKLDTATHAKTSVWNLVFKNKKIYFSLGKEGLGVLNISTKKLQRHSKKDGVCSDELSGIVTDGKEGVWLYSSSGISWFDEANSRFRNFNEADGMISENVREAKLLPSGNLLLATNRGLIQFNPEVLKKSGTLITPSLRSIQVSDQALNVNNWLRERSVVVVPHDKNYLRMEFSALDFFDTEKLQFAYRLKGAEEQWNYTTNRPVAIYSNLRGGDYQLCVKCSNSDGVWGPELCIPVFVTTPFYRQWWFMLLVLIIVSIGSFLVYRWQLRKRLAILEVRNQLSRDLHDDIGSVLSSINIFSSVAEQQMETNKDEAQKLLQRIGTSARSMMQSMDDIIWSIDPSNNQLEQLVSRMRAFAVPVLEAKDILLKMEVDEQAAYLKLDMVKRRNLFLIFKEAINNLAKYSEAKHASVQLSVAKGSLNLQIMDDGCGFNTDKPTDRHGLKNMQKRAEEVRGSVQIASEVGKGTTILIRVPLT